VKGDPPVLPDLLKNLPGFPPLVIKGGAGARNHHKARQLGEASGLFPGKKIEEGFRSEEEEELGVSLSPDLSQRIHRVGGAGPTKL
jgi:hypothetical protein